MTALEVVAEASRRMDATVKSLIECKEQGHVSQDYVSAYCEGIQHFLATLIAIMDEQN